MNRYSQEQEPAEAMPWVDIAVEAAQRINFASHGERQGVYEELSGEYKLSANHIRRMVRALTFTVEIEPKHRELAQALRAVSFKAAEITDRWYHKDPAAAVAAAKRFVTGELSLRLLAAEANGEIVSATPTKIDQSRLDLSSFREAAWKKALATIGCEVELAAHPAPIQHLSEIDRIIQDRAGQRRWGLIIVPPGLAPSSYRARRELDLGRALALQRFDITPIFALPAEASPAEFRQVLEAFDLSTATVIELSIVMAYG